MTARQLLEELKVYAEKTPSVMDKEIVTCIPGDWSSLTIKYLDGPGTLGRLTLFALPPELGMCIPLEVASKYSKT